MDKLSLDEYIAITEMNQQEISPEQYDLIEYHAFKYDPVSANTRVVFYDQAYQEVLTLTFDSVEHAEVYLEEMFHEPDFSEVEFENTLNSPSDSNDFS